MKFKNQILEYGPYLGIVAITFGGFFYQIDPTTIGVFVATIALLLNWGQLKENKKVNEMQILSGFYKDIDELQRELEALANSNEESSKSTGWDSRLFNRIEFFSFLINNRHVNRELSLFFEDSIIIWYEKLFEKYASNGEKINDREYTEFKKLYHKLKLKKMDYKLS